MQESSTQAAQGKAAASRQDLLRKSRQDRKNLSQLKKRNQDVQELTDSAKNNVDYRKIKLQNRQIIIESTGARILETPKSGNAKEFIDFDAFREKYHYAQGLHKASEEQKSSRNLKSDQLINAQSGPSQAKNTSTQVTNKGLARKPRPGPEKPPEKYKPAQKVQNFNLDLQDMTPEQMERSGEKGIGLAHEQQIGQYQTPTSGQLLTTALHARVKSNNELKMYMEKYFPQSTRVNKATEFQGDSKEEGYEQMEGLDEAGGQGGTTFNQYFLNKLAKSQGIAKVDIKQDPSQTIEPNAGEGDLLLRSPSARSGPGEEESPGEEYLEELQREKQLLLNKSKSLSKVLGPGGQTSFLANTHRLQMKIEKPEKTMLHATASFSNLRQFGSTKSFMQKGVNLRGQGPSYQSQVKGNRDGSFGLGQAAERKYSYLHNRPSLNRVKGNNQNLSINSRFMNPRAVNNLSKNMSINENFDGDSDDRPLIKNLNRNSLLYQKHSIADMDLGATHEDVILEQKSLNGSSFEQVSMGSLGAGDNQEMNLDHLLKDAEKEFADCNQKNMRFNKTQYLTQNAQKREHPRSYKHSVAPNPPTYNIGLEKIMLNKYQSIVSPKLSVSPQKFKDVSSKTFYVQPKGAQMTYIKNQSLVVQAKPSAARRNDLLSKQHSQSISNLHGLVSVKTAAKVPTDSEKNQQQASGGVPTKSNPESQLSQAKKAKANQPIAKKMNTYLMTTKNAKQPYQTTVKMKDYYKNYHQTIEQKDAGLTNLQKQSISMMKSPRTPKIDITLKKPFINVATLNQMADANSKAKKQDKPEVVPYHSRVKAMATRNVDVTKEDEKSAVSGKQEANRQSDSKKVRADKSQKAKRQSMAHVQSQALLKANQSMKTARDNLQKQSLLKAARPIAAGVAQNQPVLSQSDAKPQARKVMVKSNSRGSGSLQATQFMSKNIKVPDSVGKQTITSPTGAPKNELSNNKPKSFLMTSRNTITESLYAKGQNTIDQAKAIMQATYTAKPSAATIKTEQQKQQIREMSQKKHSVQVSLSQSIKKLDLSKITPGAPDQSAAEGAAMLSSNRKIGQAKKSMALKKSTSTNKIDFMSKDGLAQNAKQDKPAEARLKQSFPHKKHSLSQPATLMNYMTAPQSKTSKKALDDTSKAAGASGKKPAPAKSSANPQGPASQLSGMKLQSKSVLTNRSPKGQDQAEEIILSADQLKYPIAASDAKRHLSQHLNDYENQEISTYDKQIWYVGQNCKCKIKGHVIKMVAVGSAGTNSRAQSNSRKHKSVPQDNQIPSERQIERLKQMKIFNYGYDDEQGDYNAVTKDHIAYRYEILESLGSGSFGQAVKCLDHNTGEYVAIKIIRNKKKFQYQAGMELKIVKFLNMHDPHDQNNVIRVKDYVVFRDHLIISFELLSINMYEFIKNNNFQGVSQNLIRRFAIQILQALKYQQDHNLVHCDLKPENILLKQTNKSGIKLIDYGSSCFHGQRIYTYIQSRFYRAPEIILGIPYTTAIDMWSFGAIIAELYTGFPLFPGESENEQLAYIMELFGVPKPDLLKLAQRGKLFYDKTNQPILEANSRGKIRQPSGKRLRDILKCDDENFLDFLNKCFEWHPVDRMTPLQALQHPWILEGLPEKVLKHHRKMFGNGDKQETIRKLTLTEIQGFPRSKKDLTIHQIVDGIRKEDEAFQRKEESKRKQKEEEKRREAAKSQIAKVRHSPCKSQLEGSKQASLAVQEEEKSQANASLNNTAKERKTRKQRKENSDMHSFNKTDLSQSNSRLSSSRRDSLQEEEPPTAKCQLRLQNIVENDSNSKRNAKVIDVDIGEVMELQNEEADDDSSNHNMEAYLQPQDTDGEAEGSNSGGEELEFDENANEDDY